MEAQRKIAKKAAKKVAKKKAAKKKATQTMPVKTVTPPEKELKSTHICEFSKMRTTRLVSCLKTGMRELRAGRNAHLGPNTAVRSLNFSVATFRMSRINENDNPAIFLCGWSLAGGPRDTNKTSNRSREAYLKAMRGLILQFPQPKAEDMQNAESILNFLYREETNVANILIKYHQDAAALSSLRQADSDTWAREVRSKYSNMGHIKVKDIEALREKLIKKLSKGDNILPCKWGEEKEVRNTRPPVMEAWGLTPTLIPFTSMYDKLISFEGRPVMSSTFIGTYEGILTPLGAPIIEKVQKANRNATPDSWYGIFENLKPLEWGIEQSLHRI